MRLVAFFLVYKMADLLLIYLSNSSYAWLDPGRANIVAPVARFKTANKLAEPSALVVSIDQFEELFGRHVDLSLFVIVLDQRLCIFCVPLDVKRFPL